MEKSFYRIFHFLSLPPPPPSYMGSIFIHKRDRNENGTFNYL